jgi:hypothetical protein
MSCERISSLCCHAKGFLSSLQDEKTLVWYSKDREKHLSLNSVSTVVLGQKTMNFLRHRWPEKESQSLSLVYKNGECSIDLVLLLLDLKSVRAAIL